MSSTDSSGAPRAGLNGSAPTGFTGLARSTGRPSPTSRVAAGASPTDPTVRALEELVNRARATLYAAPPARASAGSYLRAGYWQAVRERGRVILFAWVLLLGSAALATVWALHDPGAAAGVVPGSLAGGGGGPHRAIGLAAGQSAALSVSIFTNNIGVTFTSFASGIVFGILPAFSLLYNGLILGAVGGIASATSHATDVIELIVPHGMLELSCIAVSAAAGMRMGWALVEPGNRRRLDALAAEAPRRRAARPGDGSVARARRTRRRLRDASSSCAWARAGGRDWTGGAVLAVRRLPWPHSAGHESLSAHERRCAG